MAVIAFIAAIGFWLQFRHLDQDEDQLNSLPEGNLVAAARDAEEEAVPHAALPEKSG